MFQSLLRKTAPGLGRAGTAYYRDLGATSSEFTEHLSKLGVVGEQLRRSAEEL